MEKYLKQFTPKELRKMTGIAKAAARLFNEKGFLETSMDDISAAARLSKGGIYHYFSSKNEMLYFISTNFMGLLLKDLEEELKKIDQNFAKIQFIISRHIEFYTKYIAEAKTTIHEGHLLPSEYFKIIGEQERQYHRIVRNVLSDFFEGQISEDQLKVLTFILFGTCNGIYLWYDPKGSMTPKELSGIIIDILCKGLAGYKVKGKTKVKGKNPRGSNVTEVFSRN
ncbi:MAG: TetR/AcrR family transcriptional regulator [Thermodesulfobacteriota bacterium]|jgi:AcrR family transcriptional regulator